MRKETPDQASPAVKHVLDGLRAAETQHLTNCTLYRPSTMFTGDNAILSIGAPTATPTSVSHLSTLSLTLK